MLTQYGFIAMSVGMLFWSLDLATTKGMSRIVAAIGRVLPALAVSVDAFGGYLTPHTVSIVTGGQAIWVSGRRHVAAAVQWWRRWDLNLSRLI